jgi:hypothetical protein
MHGLVVARNVLEPDILKYFLSNRAAGSPGVLLEDLVRVAFSRWPIEQCFEQAKNKLGLDHFEVRSWEAIHRHLYVTQLSHLFCARVHLRLREKNDCEPLPDRRAGPRGGVRLSSRPNPCPPRPDAGSTAKRPSGSRTTNTATSKPDGPIRKPPDDAFANSASLSIS